MTAAARLTAAGFSLALNTAGALVVAPAARLNDELRHYIKAHLSQLKDELRQPANDPMPAPRNRAWCVRFTDGGRCTAVNTTGADQTEMLSIARDQFGAARVFRVDAMPATDLRRGALNHDKLRGR